MVMVMTRKTGKLTANKPIGTGPDQREHGTKWKTGARGVLTPDVVREFASFGMSLTAIGYLVGCSKQNIQQAIRDDPDIQQAWCEGVAQLLLKAGKCISYNCENNNIIAGIFTAKSKYIPGEQGWVEEQYKQNKIDVESMPQVTIFLPDNGRDSPNNVSDIVDNDAFSVNDG